MEKIKNFGCKRQEPEVYENKTANSYNGGARQGHVYYWLTYTDAQGQEHELMLMPHKEEVLYIKDNLDDFLG